MLGHRASVALTEPGQDLLVGLARHQRRFGGNLFRTQASEYSVGRNTLMTVQLSACLSGTSTVRPVSGSASRMTWGTEVGQGGLFVVESDAGLVAVGQAGLFSRATRGATRMSRPGHIALTVASLDGRTLDQAHQILVTACGRCENTGMVFTENRESVGRQWGQGPVQIEPVEGILVLPQGRWQAWALDASGARNQAVPVRYTDQVSEMTLSETFATMWYLVERVSR